MSDPSKRRRSKAYYELSDGNPMIPGIHELGSGYRILTGDYANSNSCASQLFDFGAETEVVTGARGYDFSKPKTVVFHTNIGTSFTEFSGQTIEEYSMSLNSKTKLEGKCNFFSGSITFDFGMSSTKNSNNEFSRIQYDVNLWTLGLPADPRTLLKPAVKRDLETVNPFDLYNTYGTHFLNSLVIGGRAVYSSTTSKIDFTSHYSLEVIAEMSYKALVKSISAEESTEFNEDIRKFNANSTSKIVTKGGAPGFGGTSIEDHFNEWAGSVIDYPAFVDFVDENSLQPLWSLVDEPRRTELHYAYQDYCKQKQTKYEPDEGPYLKAKYVSLASVAFTDAGSGSESNLSVAKPDVGGGWYYLGQTAYNGYRDPPSETKVLLVKEIEPNTVMAPVVNWERVWDDHGSGKSHDCSLWRGVASDPVEYKVIGDFFRGGVDNQNPPSTQEAAGIVALHSKILAPAKVGSQVWNDSGSGASDDASVWNIIPINTDNSNIPLNLFVSNKSHSQPSREVFVLKSSAVVLEQNVSSRSYSENISFFHVAGTDRKEDEKEADEHHSPIKFGSAPDNIRTALRDAFDAYQKIQPAVSVRAIGYEIEVVAIDEDHISRPNAETGPLKVHCLNQWARAGNADGRNFLSLVATTNTGEAKVHSHFTGGFADIIANVVQNGRRVFTDSYEIRLLFVHIAAAVWLKHSTDYTKDLFVSLSHVIPFAPTELIPLKEFVPAAHAFVKARTYIDQCDFPKVQVKPEHGSEVGIRDGVYKIKGLTCEHQGKSMWCWVSITLGMLRKLGVPNLPTSQSDLCTAILGSDEDRTCKISEALKHYKVRSERRFYERPGQFAATLSEQIVFNAVMKQKHIPGDYYHAILTPKINFQNDGTSTIFAMDPLDQPPTKQSLTFADFMCDYSRGEYTFEYSYSDVVP